MDDVTRRKLPIIDAHHHIWDLSANYHPWLCDEPLIPFRYGDYSPIRRDYMPDAFRRDWQDFQLAGSVYVEAETDPTDPLKETEWVERIAAEAGLPSVIVAQAWLDREDAREVIAGQAAFPRVRSIRHKPKSANRREDAVRGRPGSMDDPRWRDGFAQLAGHGLHFDLQTPWWHFDAASELANDFPGTTIIVNHTGLPADRSREGLAGWRAAMDTLARRPNVMLKISGLGVPGAPWTIEANGQIVRDAISAFGFERCMFASNFPVDSLVAPLSTIFDGFLQITADMPLEARRALFHDNARRIYRIE